MIGMSYLILLTAFVAAGMSAATIGSALCGHILQWQLRSGGKRLTVDEALEDPVLLFVAMAAVSGIAAVAFSPWVMPPCLLISAFAARNAPKYFARRKRDSIRSECEQHLDTLCDIVAMGVDAGLSFDSALELYCQRFDNELSRRLGLAQRQWSHGVVTRKDALLDFAHEVDSEPVKRFADTAVHAIAHGSPLASMLRRFAAELRQMRKTNIERQVEKAPVKMLVPTGVCILPAMLLLVMGPMLLQFVST